MRNPCKLLQQKIGREKKKKRGKGRIGKAGLRRSRRGHPAKVPLPFKNPKNAIDCHPSFEKGPNTSAARSSRNLVKTWGGKTVGEHEELIGLWTWGTKKKGWGGGGGRLCGSNQATEGFLPGRLQLERKTV